MEIAQQPNAANVARQLAELYQVEFGGKGRGRFRISMKHMRMLTGRRRVGGDLVAAIAEELFELGYVMVDLETYFVVLAQSTFRNYRRVNDACLATSQTMGRSGQVKLHADEPEKNPA